MEARKNPNSDLRSCQEHTFTGSLERLICEAPSSLCEYLRPRAAAGYLGISESTLAKLRMRNNRGSGPRFIKRGGIVIYRRIDLDIWLEEHFVEGDA